MKKIKLFCIPFSGGSGEAYFVWKKYLSAEIELLPIDLPGRGRRAQEKPCDVLDDLLDDISEQIIRQLRENDSYAIYGHSVGAMLAYETYYRIKEKSNHEPCHMFFSGRKAPQNMEKRSQNYLLPDEEFLKVIYMYGNNSRRAMENPSLRKMFMPILRADFKIGETYIYKDKDYKIPCNTTVINGSQDMSVADADMNEWKNCTDKSCNIKKVLGGHFFILDNCVHVANIINQELFPYISLAEKILKINKIT